jgi:hypothetical protein
MKVGYTYDACANTSDSNRYYYEIIEEHIAIKKVLNAPDGYDDVEVIRFKVRSLAEKWVMTIDKEYLESCLRSGRYKKLDPGSGPKIKLSL